MESQKVELAAEIAKTAALDYLKSKHEFRNFPVQGFIDFNLTGTPTYISIRPPPTEVLPNDSKVWRLAESESDKLRTKPLPVICGIEKRENSQKPSTDLSSFRLMILNSGEYIHIIQRQLFPEDVQRHFVSTVESHEGTLVRVKGYLFAMDSKQNEFVRRPQLRTRFEKKRVTRFRRFAFLFAPIR